MATQLNQVYKCNVCGNMTEVVHTGVGILVCCGKPMELLSDEVKAEISTEKHIPIIEKNGSKVKIKVGSIPHPMTIEHHIEWIEIICTDAIYRVYLQPEQAPEAEFEIIEEIITVRAYCNLHGLRKN